MITGSEASLCLTSPTGKTSTKPPMQRGKAPHRGFSSAMITLLLALQKQRLRILNEILYAYEELHGVGAVNDAVVVGEG